MEGINGLSVDMVKVLIKYWRFKAMLLDGGGRYALN
jgi:hypothetical protein